MFQKTLLTTALSGALMISGLAMAADQDKDQTMTQAQDRTQDRIYGRQLMTTAEINTFREKMRAAKTVQEREQIREEHHKLMQARAKERGITLPDSPRPMRDGMGPGGGHMGPGGGMGGGNRGY
jgi:hypothetical protein